MPSTTSSRKRPKFTTSAYPWADTRTSLHDRIEHLKKSLRFRSSFLEEGSSEVAPDALLHALSMDSKLFDTTIDSIIEEMKIKGEVIGDFPLYTFLPISDKTEGKKVGGEKVWGGKRLPEGAVSEAVVTAFQYLTLGDILSDPLVRSSIGIIPGTLFNMRFFSQDFDETAGEIGLDGLDTILDSSTSVLSLMMRILPTTPDSVFDIGFVSDVHPLVPLPSTIRTQLHDLPTDEALTDRIEFIASDKTGALFIDLSGIIAHLSDDQRNYYFDIQGHEWAETTNISEESLEKIREEFRNHSWHYFYGYNQTLDVLAGLEKREGVKFPRWQIAKFLRFTGCLPRPSVEPFKGPLWNLIEMCRGILCIPENLRIVSSIHDILEEAAVHGLFDTDDLTRLPPASSDVLKFNRYIQTEKIELKYHEVVEVGLEEKLDRLGTRITSFLGDLKDFLTQFNSKNKHRRRKTSGHGNALYLNDSFNRFHTWCDQNNRATWLFQDYWDEWKPSLEREWIAQELRGNALFFRKLLHYIGGRLVFTRKYATCNSNGICGTFPKGLEGDIFDLYLFYLEISFLLAIPTSTKEGRKGTVNHLIGILLNGDISQLGNVSRGITDTLNGAGKEEDRQQFMVICDYFKGIREGTLARKNVNLFIPSAGFRELWRLVEACQHSSSEYPAILVKLFQSAGIIAEEKAKQAKLAEIRAKDKEKTGNKDKIAKEEKEVKLWAVSSVFFSALYENEDIQLAMRRYISMQGLLGHLYRTHLFYLPPDVLDCDPFFGLPRITLEQANLVATDIETARKASTKGYLSGSRCRVLPDLSYIIEVDDNTPMKEYFKDNPSVEDYLKTLAKVKNNREIYYLGRRIANWRVFAYFLNCMRVAALNVTDSGSKLGMLKAVRKDIMTGLSKAGLSVRKLRTKSTDKAILVYDAIRDILLNDTLSLARWILTATFFDETKDAILKKLQGKQSRTIILDRARAYRNQHDRSKSADWPNWVKRDDPESYNTKLGKYLNRQRFYARWKGFAKLVRIAAGLEKGGTSKLEARLCIAEGIEDFTLLYFVPLNILIPSTNPSGVLPLDGATGLFSQSTIPGIRQIAELLRNDALVIENARRLISIYPSYLSLFIEKQKSKEEEEKEKKEIISLTPGRLVSAVLKALVKEYEDRLRDLVKSKTLESTSEGDDDSQQIYKNLISRCVHAIYTHEYILANSYVEEEEKGEEEKEEAEKPAIEGLKESILRQALRLAGLPVDGLSFLALTPAFLPRAKLLQLLADLGHRVLNEPFVVDSALSGPNFAAEAAANPDFFKRSYHDLRDVIYTVLELLATIRLSADKVEDLRLILDQFVIASENWWDYHVYRVLYEWSKVEGEEEEGTEGPKEPDAKIPLKILDLKDLLVDSKKLREGFVKIKKVIPLNINTGKDSVGRILALSHWTRVLSRPPDKSGKEVKAKEKTIKDVIKFTLRGPPFQNTEAFQKKYAVPIFEENLLNIPPSVLFGFEKKEKGKSVVDKGQLKRRIGEYQDDVDILETKREVARVLDYQLRDQFELLEKLTLRRKIVVSYLIEKNRLKKKRVDFTTDNGDLSKINKRLTEQGQLPLFTKEVEKSEDSEVPAQANEVKGIQAIWETMNTLLGNKQDLRSTLKQKIKLASLDSFFDAIFDHPPKSVDEEYEDLKTFASGKELDIDSFPETELKQYLEIIYQQVNLEHSFMKKTAAIIIGHSEEKECADFITVNRKILETDLPLGISLEQLQKTFPDSVFDRVKTIRTLIDEFFEGIRPFVVNTFNTIDFLKKDLEHLQGSPGGHKDLYDTRLGGWRDLVEDSNLKRFFTMENFPCIIRLPKSIPQKLRVENGGGGIFQIQILPPQLPHRHVIANVAMRGPKDTVSPVPLFVETLAKFAKKHGSGQVHIIGVDNNRLYCRRMFAFCGVNADGIPQSFEEEKPPSEEEFAILVGTYDYQIKGLNDKSSIKHEIFDKNAGFINDTRTHKFASRFNNKFLPKEKTYQIPHNDSPFKIRSAKHDWTFSDFLAAPAFYWADTRSTLMRIMRGCNTKRRSIDEDTRGKLSLEQELKRQRLRTELIQTNARASMLRQTAIDYWMRVLCYVILRYDPKGLAYEKLRFNPWGMTGGLSVIVASMVKDFSEVVSKVLMWLSRLGITPKCIDQIKPVRASGTSQECVNNEGKSGPVDRRASSDWIWCFIQNKVVDAHITSAGNIGRRHPLLDKKTSTKSSVKLVNVADSKEIQQQLTEFRYKRAVQWFFPWYTTDKRS